jgi:hypothetical protein
MSRSEALERLDWTVVFVAMCGLFLWQLLTPEYRVLTLPGVTWDLRPRRPQ